MGFWGSLLVAILTLAFTVVFAMWRFQSEKWFNLKVTTYIKILKLLHPLNKKIQEDYEYLEATEIGGTSEEGYEYFKNYQKTYNSPQSQKKRKKLDDIIEESKFNLDKMIDVGAFVIKQEAIDCLVKLKKGEDFMEDEEPEDYVERRNQEIDACYKEIKRIAHEDLKTGWDLIKEYFKC